MASFGMDLRQDTREMPRGQTPPVASTMPSAALTPTPQAMGTALHKVAVLGPTLRFKGELSAEEDFVLQGTLEGSIHNPQCVTVGTEGSVVGDIKARVITIDGKIEGDLYGGESVVVHQTGRVTGNIFAPRVGIVEGAYFSGRVEMGAPGAIASQSQSQSQSSASSSTTTPRVRVTTKPSDVVTGVPLSAEETERLMGSK